MDDAVGGFVLATFLWIFVALAFVFGLWDSSSARLRYESCVAICGKAEAYSSSPSLCVCRDGKTHHGKAPEFYR